jgi:hypothetical protein
MPRRISIGAFLKDLAGWIFKGLKPVATNFLNDLALEVVTEVSKLDLSSEEKRVAALKLLRSKLNDLHGRTFKARFPDGVKDSLLNFLIELAVQRFKSGVAAEATQVATDQ